MGLPDHLWRRLAPEEKLYVKGLDIERHGDFRSGVYQEFARGFGVRDYRYLLHTGKANRTRLKTASELKRSDLGDTAFGRSLVRHALYAVWRAAESREVADSLTWFRTELPDYWPPSSATSPPSTSTTGARTPPPSASSQVSAARRTITSDRRAGTLAPVW